MLVGVRRCQSARELVRVEHRLGGKLVDQGQMRDLIADAWQRSAEISVGYPPVAVKDVESGAVNGLNALQGVD